MSWHPTLDDIERRPDGPQTRPRPSRDNREPSTRGLALGSGDCWCGAERGHDWPGKALGAPHPDAAYAYRDPARVTPARLAELRERDRRRALLERPAYRPASGQSAERKAAIDRFAKLRAKGLTVAQASDAMGIARSTGRGYARAIARRRQ